MLTAVDRAAPIATALGRPNRFEVDLDAIAHNIRVMRQVIGPQRRMYFAVKANGYGFGLDGVSDAALAAGADALAMVSVVDAVRLRERGIRVPILIYPGNLPNADVVAAVSRYALSPTIGAFDEAKAYSAAPTPLKAFVKVDVGYERNGIAPDEGLRLLTYMRSFPNIEVEGIYTHLHLEDDSPLQYLEWQFQRFVRLLSDLERAGIQIPVRMAASSSVLHMSLDTLLNSIDVGHIIYGLVSPSPALVRFELRPAFHALKSRLTTVKQLQRTDFVDNAPFPPAGVARIGVIPLGRIDGIASLTTTHVLVGSRRVRLLGGPSLEHYRVDLTDVPDAAVGDEVVVIGRQGGEEITLQEVMAHQGIPREVRLVTQISPSVPRAYVRLA